MIRALRSSRHSAGMAGATTSSAAAAMSKKSMPVVTPSLWNTPVSASTGAVAAPAPPPADLLAYGAPLLDAVLHPHPQTPVAVEADLGVLAQLGDKCGDPVA